MKILFRNPKFWAFMTLISVTLSALFVFSDSIQEYLVGARFMPHGYCFFWNSFVLYLLVAGNGLIWLCYMFTASQLVFVFRWGGKLFNRQLLLWFGAFIFLCGWTHFMQILNIYYAKYVVEGTLTMFTAFVSLVTVCKLFKAKNDILLQIAEDRKSITSAINILEGVTTQKPSNNGEFQEEVEAATERLRQLKLLQLEFLKEKEQET
jgi:hypothetical protein